MEPPSSVNSDQNKAAGIPVDDPLSKFLATGSYFVVTGCPEYERDSSFVVCGYSPLTGMIYFGTTGELYS